MSTAKGRVNWNVFKVELFMACQTKQCIESAGKQRSISSSVNKGKKGCHNIPRKLEIKSKEIKKNRCDIGSPWNHREAFFIYLFSFFIYNLFYVE